ncbi:uncharacterized protein LOC135470436 isoform X2 [Liolophura sinensis]|uniref:uncharacterized protein LOC135470436 isoform X2 n=1 Tax=Liolophura sinensis TaxID=3198878 RepID=UPI0031584346
MPKCGRRNEKPEFEFLTHPKEADFVLKNAPFGTTLTPSTRMKIVGGKPIYFIDSVKRYGEENESPRRIFKHVADKPNHIDPWMSKRGPQGYSTADWDNFNSQVHPSRQEGHDLSPYKVIPPIQENTGVSQAHQNNDFFEHRTVQDQRSPYENRQIHHNVSRRPETPEETSMNVQQVTSQSYPPLSDKESLLRLLPPNVYLPREPLHFSKEDELRLLTLLNDELRELEAQRLKDIYLDLTSYDKQLRGWCYMQDLSYVLGRHRIFLSPDILRLVACQYVSDREDGKINYEKVLSFFGTALRTSQGPSQTSQTQSVPQPERFDNHYTYADSPRSEALPPTPRSTRPLYYVSKESKPITPVSDSETSKLMRLIEQQLLDSGREVDFDKLTLDFRKMDPNHRGTMSAAQVKQIIYSSTHQIPLQESLVNQILAKCDHHGDGQYHWMQFIEFLEKVQPRQTGLTIPKSKRPLEYAKDYGNPSSNWPHAEVPKPSNYEQSSKQEIPDVTRKTPLPTYARDYNGNTGNPYEQDGRISQLDVEKKERELREIEKEYERMKRQMLEEKDESEPWFQRFLKMAASIYSQDVDSSGYLPYDEVKKMIRLYNDAYNLRITEQDVDRAIMDNYIKGKVAIHDMLTELGASKT